MAMERSIPLRVPEWFVVRGKIAEVTKSSLANYLARPVNLETKTTFGDESNQINKLPTRKGPKNVLVDASKLSFDELIAESRRF